MPQSLESLAQRLEVLVRECKESVNAPRDIGRTLELCAQELQQASAAVQREIALLRNATSATQADLERKLEEISLLRLIADISGRLVASEHPFSTILDNLLQITHADSGSIFMLDEKSQRLQFVSAAGARPEHGPNRPSFALGEGIAGRVVAEGEAVLIGDTTLAADFVAREDTRVTVRSLVSYPLLVGEKAIGVLNLSATAPHIFSDETLRILHIIAAQLANVVQNARLLAAQRAQTEQLRESERRYRELVENVNDGFFLLDETGRTLLCNEQLSRIFGRTREEIVAADSWRPFLAPDSAERVLDALQRIRTAPFGLEEDLEFTVARPDGTCVPVHMHCRTADQSGRIVWVGMVRDMTAQKALQQQLLQSEKLASLGTLIAGTTHELNNKLAPILGYTQLLLEADLPEAAQTRLARIEEAAEGAKHIVESLLGFSRDSEVRREPTRVSEAIDRVLALSEAPLRRTGVNVVRHLADDLPTVFAARPQLEQVLLNLVNNAMHAMEKSDRRQLEISAQSAGSDIEIAVGDTGCGIPAEHVSRIFDPFFTTKPVNQGTGLGLSLSYGIVRAHGGEIRVESQEGQGTTFRITLPVGQSHAEAPLVSRPDAHVEAKGRLRLLVVEDEEAVRYLLADLLADWGEIHTAQNGREALTKIGQGPYDLIFLDIRMPDMDGMTLYNVLAAEHPRAAARVVFMTGDTYDPETRRFLDACRRPCVSKPFNMKDVLATVREQISITH